MRRNLNESHAVISAIMQGNLAYLQTFLADRDSLDDPIAQKKNALHLAAEFGQTPIIHFLLDAGADAHCVDDEGETALHGAVSKGQLEAVRALLAAGLDPNAVGYWGNAPLNLAAHFGHTEIVDALLAAGADVHLRDRFQATPLHAAAQGGHTAIIRRLIAAGADLEAKRQCGNTPVDLALSFPSSAEPIVAIMVAMGLNAFDKIQGRTLIQHFSHRKAAKDSLLAIQRRERADDCALSFSQSFDELISTMKTIPMAIATPRAESMMAL